MCIAFVQMHWYCHDVIMVTVSSKTMILSLVILRVVQRTIQVMFGKSSPKNHPLPRKHYPLPKLFQSENLSDKLQKINNSVHHSSINYFISSHVIDIFGKIKWRIWIPKVVVCIEMSYQKIQIIRHLTWDSVFEALYN